MKTSSLLFLAGALCFTILSHAVPPITQYNDSSSAPRNQIQNPTFYQNLGGRINFDPAYEYGSRGLYFPLIPPALAEMPASPRARKLPTGHPVDVDGFIGETFYLPYKGVLIDGYLLPRRAQRIEAYRIKRDQLLVALRGRLEELKALTGAPRESALAEFANIQAGVLHDLAFDEEAIRSDFTTSGFFKLSIDGAGTTIYHPDATRENFLPLDPGPEEAIKAAQFQAGLSTQQRLLLHEISIELQLSGENASLPGPYVFFWPATARIRLPVDLPAALAAKFAEFQALKNTLKSELRTAITRGQNFILLGNRTQTYTRLADEQTGRFAALEALAEEIRLGLADLPYPDEPARTELPTDLTHRAGDTIARKAVLLRELNSQLKEFRRALLSDRIELVPQGNGLAIAVIPIKSTPQRDKPARAATIARLQTLNEDFSRRFAALSIEIEALRSEIQRAHGTSDRGVSRDADQVADEFEKSYAIRKNWDRFHDYYMAVIHPGLSPAQRRLLFNGALVDMEMEKTNGSN